MSAAGRGSAESPAPPPLFSPRLRRLGTAAGPRCPRAAERAAPDPSGPAGCGSRRPRAPAVPADRSSLCRSRWSGEEGRPCCRSGSDPPARAAWLGRGKGQGLGGDRWCWGTRLCSALLCLSAKLTQAGKKMHPLERYVLKSDGFVLF